MSPRSVFWFIRRPLLARTSRVLSVLARRGLLMLFTSIDNSFSRQGRAPILPARGNLSRHAVHLRLALTELGTTFVKLGQAMSSRSDLLPPEFIDELNKLQDEVPPYPFNEIKTTLESELGAPLIKVFAEFDPNPIASASIGQVYAARLWGGEEVVVKVIRPGVEEEIEKDLEIVAGMAEWAAANTFLGKMYDLLMLVDEFSNTLLNELDYQREGRNIDTFRDNFKDDPKIYIPRVHWDLTTRRVITMERVRGIKINDLPGLDNAAISRSVVAENLLHFALRQVFEFDHYHADPHAGNFFVQADGSLAVMDFGMVGRLTHPMRKALLGIAQAIQRQDPDLMIDEFFAADIFNETSKRKALTREINHFLELFSFGALQDLTATKLAREIMDIALRYHLQLPSELVALARAIAISEGTGMMLYPDLKMSEFARPYIRKSFLLQESLKEMLPRVRQAALDSVELGLGLPRRTMRLLEQLERGQIEFNINIERLAKLMSQLQRMTNRMALSVILAGTIVSLGMVTVVYHPAQWQQMGEWIFGLAFVSSLIFGAWLMWSILRSN